jgi:uncharacterized membrane protein
MDTINPSDVIPAAEEIALEHDHRARNLTLNCYILYWLAFLGLIPMVVAIVLNYTKKDIVKDTVYQSHFRWQVQTFWITLGCALIAASFYFPLGWNVVYALWFFVWVWYIYRMYKGMMKWSEMEAV